MTNHETEFTATLAERTIVVSWPDNERGGAVLPPDNWQERAWEERTLHEIDEGSISGCSVLRWRDDPRTDAELLAVSLALVTGKPAAVSVPPPATRADADLPDRLEAALTERFTELGNPFSEMRRHEQGPDGWPASHPVGPHQVSEVLRELLDGGPVAGEQQNETPEAEPPTTTKPETGTCAADPLAGSATEYRVPVPEGGGTNLIVRRQGVAFGAGWSVAVPGWGGGRAWTAEGWQDSISALSVDRLFCWPDPETAVTEARSALAAGVRQDGAQP